MKLKNNINIIFNLNVILIFFIFGITDKVYSTEKNFVIATIDRSPITYFDLKEKAKLIHFLRTKSSDYKNLDKYFVLSLESLITEKLLINANISSTDMTDDIRLSNLNILIFSLSVKYKNRIN